ncbi:MAG: hypothetical protein JKY31_11310 [Rhodobacteraceae bacterium]|nr:hypothetical protein [Paracoccaceae bacterium]
MFDNFRFGRKNHNLVCEETKGIFHPVKSSSAFPNLFSFCHKKYISEQFGRKTVDAACKIGDIALVAEASLPQQKAIRAYWAKGVSFICEGRDFPQESLTLAELFLKSP